MEQTPNDILTNLYDSLKEMWDIYHGLPKYSYSKSEVCDILCKMQEHVRFACNCSKAVWENLQYLDNELDMMWKTILIFPESTKWSKNDVLALINETIKTVRIYKECFDKCQ